MTQTKEPENTVHLPSALIQRARNAGLNVAQVCRTELAKKTELLEKDGASK
jgi:post-segregation antitoxin (ccd killing protein)